MKLATVTLTLSKDGHHVTLHNVTPAELLLLVAEHHTNAGGNPVVKESLVETGDTTKVEVEEDKDDGKGGKTKVKVIKTVTGRTPAEEVARLRMKYAGNKVSALFQGAIPNMPKDFKEAQELGVKTALPSSKLTEFKVA